MSFLRYLFFGFFLAFVITTKPVNAHHFFNLIEKPMFWDKKDKSNILFPIFKTHMPISAQKQKHDPIFLATVINEVKLINLINMLEFPWITKPAKMMWNWHFTSETFQFGTWFFKTIVANDEFAIETGVFAYSPKEFDPQTFLPDGILIGLPVSSVKFKFFLNKLNHNQYLFLQTSFFVDYGSWKFIFGYICKN